MSKILVLNGPNLGLLGVREPGHYGSITLDDINKKLESSSGRLSCKLSFYQSNAEHKLIDQIHSASSQGVDFIVFNPAGFTHTSISLRDALLAVKIPFIEIHLSNVYAREDFRRHSYFSDIAVGVISGLGPIGYELALEAAIGHLQD